MIRTPWLKLVVGATLARLRFAPRVRPAAPSGPCATRVAPSLVVCDIRPIPLPTGSKASGVTRLAGVAGVEQQEAVVVGRAFGLVAAVRRHCDE